MLIVFSLTVVILSLFGFIIWKYYKSNDREKSFLKGAAFLITIILVMMGMLMLMSFIYSVFVFFHQDSILSLLHSGIYFGNKENSFSVDMSKQSFASSTFYLLKSMVNFGLLICLREFLKNIYKEDIFISQNVTLIKWSACLLVLGSFVTEGIITLNLSTLELHFLNVGYLLSAVVVFAISKIMERAVAIALENEYTI